MCVGACDHILSRQALNAVASRDSDTVKAYLVRRTPGRSDWMSGLVPGQGGQWNGLTGGKILSVNFHPSLSSPLVFPALNPGVLQQSGHDWRSRQDHDVNLSDFGVN
jgi:hypothetical protein